MAYKNYIKFFNRYGGSFRTRYLNGFEIPETSNLPKEFIRLEPWEGQYLFHVASRAKLGIVETGRLKGGSTFMMAYANREVPIYSVDIAPKDDKFLREQMDKNNIGKNVELIVGDSQKTKYKQAKKYDVLFIDGDHSYEGALNDLENWFPRLSKNGHIIIHDVYDGMEVKNAIIDFVEKNSKKVEYLISPYKRNDHWIYPEGSLGHLRKL